jgi:hypothetical protein
MEITPQEQDFLDRVGIILTGLRRIGAYMGVSAMTILRWHECYRGKREPRLCFPLLWTPTGKGLGWTYKTHTALIAEWIQRWSEIDSKERQNRPRYRRRREKPLQMGVTNEPNGVCPIEKKETPIREEVVSPARPKQLCTCGTPTLCIAHD